MTKLEIFKRNRSSDTWLWTASTENKLADGCFTFPQSRESFDVYEEANKNAKIALGESTIITSLVKL